jgi:hypothetical protein
VLGARPSARTSARAPRTARPVDARPPCGEPGHALGRHEPGQDALALRPGRGEEQLALGEPVRAEVRPDRAVVDRDDLGGLRLALGAERGEALGRHALDRDPVQDAHGKRADDGLAPHLLAVSSVTRQPRRHGDGGRDGAEPDALAELGAHAQCDLGGALRDLEALPQVVGVEAVVADGRGLAKLGQERRRSLEPAASASAPASTARTSTAAHRPTASSSAQERPSRRAGDRDATTGRRDQWWRPARRTTARRRS